MKHARPGSMAAWRMATRPATLPAGAAPVIVGAAVAQQAGRFEPSAVIFALLGALFIQIGTNYANDVFDFEKGADTSERVGPVRAAQAGLLSARALKVGMVLSFVLAALCGVYLTWVAGPVILVIGVASILAGVLYTGGPWPLGYHGLGDVFVMLFFGFVAVCGTVYVQTLEILPMAWPASLGVGALSTAILVVNNIRDRKTDIKAGKRTLVVRLGRQAGTTEYGLMLALAYGSCAVMAWMAGLAWSLLLPLLTLPHAIGLARKVARQEGAALNPLLGATARLLLLYSLLLAFGLWLA